MVLLESYDALKDLYEEKRSFSHRVVVAVILILLMVCLLVARLGDL